VALNFPSNPSVNDTYSYNNKTWLFNGQGWILATAGSINGIPIGNVTPATGNFTTVGATGNITTGQYFIGNGSQLSGITYNGLLTVSNTAPVSPNSGDQWIAANTGVQYIYFSSGGNSQWAEMEADTSFNFGSDANLTAVSTNIIPVANITYDIGTTSNRFRDIYLANSTIYLGDASISATGGNLVLPSNVSIGNVYVTESGGVLAFPAGTTIGGSSPEMPKISNVQITDSSYTVLDDTAIDTNGGYFIVNGSGFVSGATVIVEGTTASSVNFVNSTLLRCQIGSKTASSYNVYVVNPDGGTAINPAGLTFSSFPAWSTGSTLANANTNTAFSYNLVASNAVSYTLAAGNSVPNGSSLLSNGLFSGNVSVNSNTAYSFTVVATDAEAQDSPRTFTFNVIFVAKPQTVEYLVVAGGGGGGGGISGTSEAGGGGAGGYISSTANITEGTTYTVVVGGGGGGGPGPSTGGVGGNSSAFGTTSVGGGGGAGYTATAGSGGSGGGSYAGGAGSGTPGQGNPGGAGGGFGQAGGGGGGAGQPGSPGPTGGRGGNGNVWLNGTFYAGGGGTTGTAGGSGGGGTGKPGPGAGVTNTGGGGGAGVSTSSQPGGSGGSGVVILRYEDYLDPAANTNGTVSVTTSNGYRYYAFTSSGNIRW
jgi:hypothetical protein